MGHEAELKGPDLEAGVAIDDVPEGGSLLGHAQGHPVLLVRQRQKVFAVGAVCTHFSGPLEDGLVVGNTVRCPWHQACFDLETGAPSSPAFEPIPCFRVHHHGARVKVGPKLPVLPPQPVASQERVVIVGAGAAGSMAAESLRRLGHAGAITLLGAEATPPVDRTNLSKDYLAGNAPEEWMVLRDQQFYQKKNIDLRLDTQVTEIDQKAQVVHLVDGTRLEFDALILATGASPVQLHFGGATPVQTLRTLADSRAIIEKAKKGKRAIVIGASFIGLEVSASLRARGVHVQVVAPDHLPLERILGQELARLVYDVHLENGVEFHLGHKVSALEGNRATLDDGSHLEADFVVAGVGVQPCTELAEKAKLAVDHGILVDEHLRAAPHVYAIGDVARYPDHRSGELVRIEHWVVAQRQGEAVARTLLGHNQPFRDVPFFWSAHYDLTINYVGHASSWDRLDVEGDLAQRDAAVHYFKGDRLLAVATVGRDRYALEVARRFENE